MKYKGEGSDYSNSSNKTGVLLVNLGTPDRPVCPSLRKYLSEFLMDPRVVEIPKLLRLILVRGIIVNVRSHKSAANYRKIWSDRGSPLMVNSIDLVDKVANAMGEEYSVMLAMRYGSPSMDSQIKALHKSGVRRLIVLPLYPQYSGSTSGSTFDALAKSLSTYRWVPSLSFVDSYYDHPLYIKALADSVRKHWGRSEKAQKLVMTFHGVPIKFIDRGDPYFEQCKATAKLLADELELRDDDWLLVFQSRLGAEPWLQPYCDETLKNLPGAGVESVDMICPGFSADCLETLEEIDGENREYFMNAGGKSYSYIPCLNDSNAHTALISKIVEENLVSS
jgi:ferrochelatase